MARRSAVVVLGAAWAVAAVGCDDEPECPGNIGPEIRALAAEFSAGCSVDPDCVSVVASTSCYVGCGTVIRAGQEQAFAAALKGLDDRVCAPAHGWGGNRCVLYADCMAPVPRCTNGACADWAGVADAGP